MMKRFLMFALLATGLAAQTTAQNTGDNSINAYRATSPRINDLVHTKLDVKFDYDKSYMNGKAWITLQPHFYATDTLSLDAKGMDIHKVELVKGASNKTLKYDYDGWVLKVKLDKQYKGGE